jgi:hypothetical protein
LISEKEIPHGFRIGPAIVLLLLSTVLVAQNVQRSEMSFNVHSPGINYQSSLRKMSFLSTNNTLKKIAVRLTDVSGFVLEDVHIGPIGYWDRRRLDRRADPRARPEPDPASHHRGGHAHQDRAQRELRRLVLTIRHTRSEQLNGGWTVYISTARGIRHVTLDNVKGGSGEAWKGFYLRHVRYLQLLNTQYAGTTDNVGSNDAIGLDIDDVLSVSFLNCFWNIGSVRNMGDLRRMFAINQNYESDYATFTTEYWESDVNPNVSAGLAMRVGGGTPGATGANHIGGSGTLAHNATTVLPTAGASAKVLYIQVFTNGAGGRTEGGTALISSSSVTKLNGTAGFDVVAGANRIAIDTSGGWGNVVLRNTTGVEMSFGYTIWWI